MREHFERCGRHESAKGFSMNAPPSSSSRRSRYSHGYSHGWDYTWNDWPNGESWDCTWNGGNWDYACCYCCCCYAGACGHCNRVIWAKIRVASPHGWNCYFRHACYLDDRRGAFHVHRCHVRHASYYHVHRAGVNAVVSRNAKWEHTAMMRRVVYWDDEVD